MSNNVQFEGEDLTFEGEVITFQGEPDNETFGFPPEVVALIEARHGSVKRYLRLRLLGQI